jgi:hypothetical protein
MQSSRSYSKATERPNELHLTERRRNDGNINITFNKSYSEDDISPAVDMNCKKVIDKPTLVKRLTMGLLRMNDQESRQPLGIVFISINNFDIFNGLFELEISLNLKSTLKIKKVTRPH